MPEQILSLDRAVEVLDDLDTAAHALGKLIKRLESGSSQQRLYVRRQIDLVKSWLDDAREKAQ